MDSKDPALTEAKRHLDHQIGLIQHQAEEAIEVIKINLLIFSALLGFLQLSGTSATLGLYFAGLPLVLSILVSVIGYLRVNPTIGLNKEGINDLTDADDSVENVLLTVYAEWINENHNKSTQNHFLIWFSLFLTTISLGAVSGLVLFL